MTNVIAKAVTKATISLGKLWFKTKQSSPEILLVGGFIFLAAGTYFAIDAGRKVDGVIDEEKGEQEELQETIEGLRKDLTDAEDSGEQQEICEDIQVCYDYMSKSRRRLYWKLCKLFGPMVACDILACLCFGKSFGTLKGRLTSLMTAYQALEATNMKIRKSIREEYGEEAEQRLFNGQPEIVRKYDENGNPIETPNQFDFNCNPNDILTLDFNAFTAPGYWDNSPNYFMRELLHTLNWFQMKLDTNYEVTYREVLIAMGRWDTLTKEQRALAMIYGWRHGGSGPQYIDFGLSDALIKDYDMCLDDDMMKKNIRLRFNAYPILTDYTKAKEENRS